MTKPRIVAGEAKGRELETPPKGTRPSPSRLRGAIFDALQGREGGRFLDLYAGSGAVGLEAASRGFRATLVERDRVAADVVRRNARRLGLDVEIVQSDALVALRDRTGAFDVVFVDPPYDLDLPAVFAQVVALAPVAAGGRYLFQHPADVDPRLRVASSLERAGVEARRTETRRYGTNRVLVVDVL